MSTSQTYHQLTNYSPQRAWHEPLDDPRLVKGFRICDEDLRPPEFKTYDPGLPIADLPVELRPPNVRAATLDLPELARLLFYSAGVVRYRDTAHGRIHYRAAGSAGNRHPLEIYVCTPGLDGLPAGVWHHDPLHHRLTRIASTHDGGGPTFLVVTGVPWRSAWKYAERAWRHLWWDCGTMLSHLLALADSGGTPARLQLSFPDRAVAGLVGADGTDEFPLAVAVLGDGQPAFTSRGRAESGTLASRLTRFPLILAAQRATESAGPGWTTGPHASPVSNGAFAPPAHTLEDAIRRRGSARRFDMRAELPEAGLMWAVDVATRHVAWDAGPSLLQHHLIVHNVHGVPQGIYRWKNEALQPVCAGDQRQAAHHYCLSTDLARDAGYLVVHTADLPATVDRLGERGYRAAQLEAGIVEGRLHLAAHTLGHGATGLVFNDELTAALLRTNSTGLLATALGVPAYQAKPGGPPRQPTRLRPA